MRKLLVVCLLLSSCSGGCDFGCYGLPSRPSTEPDFKINNVGVYVEDKNSLNQQNIQQRLSVILSRSLYYWGNDNLEGYDIVFINKPSFKCGFETVIGCTYKVNKTIVISVFGERCVEALPIPHEVGHASIPWGDPFHIDNGFHNMNGLWHSINDNNSLRDTECINKYGNDPNVQFTNWDEDFNILVIF